MAALKFFSPEWCERNIEVSNDTKEIYEGFKDASAFTVVLVFEVTDKKLVSSVEYIEGYIKSWTASDTPNGVAFARFSADQDTWRSAAQKQKDGSQLFMDGKIRLEFGPLEAVTENAGAFDNFLKSWGELETDWAL